MKKKAFFIAFFCAFFLAGLTITANGFAGGNGTEADPYLVETAGQLNNVKNHLSAHFRQIADIDLSDYTEEEGWEPIGYCYDWDDNEPFLGNYNGNGYKITSLVINRSDTNGIGLFGYLGEAAKLKNMSLEGIEVSGYTVVGGLVGLNWNGTITNSYATGNVSGDEYVGGLVGGNGGGIMNSYAVGKVSGKQYVGGLVGYNADGTITNSYATGEISGDWYVGGLVGFNVDGITNSYATGNVSGQKWYIGGLVGYNETGDIANSYATGNVSGIGDVGGLVGVNVGGTILSSYYNIETTGQPVAVRRDTAKGVPKTTEEMMRRATFEGWDFGETWSIDEGESYPYFQR